MTMQTTETLNRSTTDRGFITFDEFPDMYRSTVTVRESSGIIGGVWIFCHADPTVATDPMSPLLNRTQLDRLIAALQVARAECHFPEDDDDDE